MNDEKILLDDFLNRVKMTRKDLEPLLGVNHSTLSFYASGRAFPDYKKCKKLLEIGMTIGELFGSDIEAKILGSSVSSTEINIEKFSHELCRQIVQKALQNPSK